VKSVPGRGHIDADTTAHHERRQRRKFISGYARQRTERSLGDRHNSSVETQADKSSPLPLSPRTTMLLRTAGFAALMAWMPLLIGASRDTLPGSSVESAKPATAIDAGTPPPKGLARRKLRCGECGLIESIRETEGQGEAIPLVGAVRPVAENRNRAPARSASREITIRLEDGSSRVIVDANPGSLRLGERVKVIDGLAGPGA